MYSIQALGQSGGFTKVRAFRWIALSLSWLAGVYAMLSMRHFDFAGGHTFCGPWGCGGRTEDLVAVHAAWCIALIPPVAILASKRRRLGSWYPHFAVCVLCLAIAGIVAVMLHTWLIWLPGASEYQRAFAWQRIGFIVVNMVDIPLIQMLLAGILVLRLSLRDHVKKELNTRNAHRSECVNVYR